MSSVLKQRTGTVRAMLHGDLAGVAAIERRSYDFPWSQGIFRDCLLAGYHCLVLHEFERISGYGILSIAGGEAHLLNLCISAEARGHGFGEALLDELLARSRSAAVERVLLEVRPSNQTAILLYSKHGFMPIGARRSYYQAHQGREDALVFALPMRRPESR